MYTFIRPWCLLLVLSMLVTVDTLCSLSLVPISRFDFRVCVIQLHILQRLRLVMFSFASYRCSHRCTCSRACNRLHVFPRLQPVACFSALGAGYTFCCARYRFHMFMRLARATRFPAFGTRLIFPHFVPVTRFPATGTKLKFSRSWHQFHISTRLPRATRFPALGTDCNFSPAWTASSIVLSLGQVLVCWTCLLQDLSLINNCIRLSFGGCVTVICNLLRVA